MYERRCVRTRVPRARNVRTYSARRRSRRPARTRTRRRVFNYVLHTYALDLDRCHPQQAALDGRLNLKMSLRRRVVAATSNCRKYLTLFTCSRHICSRTCICSFPGNWILVYWTEEGLRSVVEAKKCIDTEPSLLTAGTLARVRYLGRVYPAKILGLGMANSYMSCVYKT